MKPAYWIAFALGVGFGLEAANPPQKLSNEPLLTALERYRELTGKGYFYLHTKYQGIRNPFTPSAKATTQQKEAEEIKGYLQENGFHFELVSPNFFTVAPKQEAQKLQLLPKPPKLAKPEITQDILPPGSLRLVACDMEFALGVYVSLANRTLAFHPPANARCTISVVNGQTTAKEMAWVFEALFALAGMEVRPFGPRLAVALPAGGSEWEFVRNYEVHLSQAPAEVLPPLLDTLPRTQRHALNNLPVPPAQKLLNAWAQLKGLKAAEIPKALANQPLLIAHGSPLTHGEASWLLEVVAALNKWQLDLSTPGTVQLVSLSDR